MIGYKFKYTGTIGTEVLTVNCASELYFAISNGGDSEATVKLFQGTTELSADVSETPKFVLPDNEYSLFYILTPTTPETNEYTATITGAENSYVHKIDIRLIVEESTRCYDESLFYRIDDLTTIGNRVIKVPLNSKVVVGVSWDNSDLFDARLSFNVEDWDSSLKQGVYIPDDSTGGSFHGTPLYNGVYPVEASTGIEPCQKHIKAQIHSKHRTVLQGNVRATKFKMTMPDGTFQYFATQYPEDGSAGHTLYYIDENNNVLGYADGFGLYGRNHTVKIGNRNRQVFCKIRSIARNTIVGEYPEFLPVGFVNEDVTMSGSTGHASSIDNSFLKYSYSVVETITLENVPYTVYTDNEPKTIDLLFDIVEQKKICDQKRTANDSRLLDDTFSGYKFNFLDSIGDNIITVPNGVVPRILIQGSSLLECENTYMTIAYGEIPGYTSYSLALMNAGRVTYRYFQYGTYRFKATNTVTSQTLYIRLEHNNDTKFE